MSKEKGEVFGNGRFIHAKDLYAYRYHGHRNASLKNANVSNFVISKVSGIRDIKMQERSPGGCLIF